MQALQGSGFEKEMLKPEAAAVGGCSATGGCCGGDHEHDHDHGAAKMAHKTQNRIKKKENGISNAHPIMILDYQSLDFIPYLLMGFL